jgi:large subunit ribosomal protein L7e
MAKAPESVLKKQKTQAAIAATAKATALALKKQKRLDKKEFLANGAKYEAEYNATVQANIKARREAKASGSFFVPQQPKIAFVVRIRGIIGVHPKPKKIMQLFRLRQIHNGTFVKLNEATIRMLRVIEPYVTYGYPSLKTVRDLIYKRGFGKVNKQRVPISENAVIQSDPKLVAAGIKCVDDLIHEIYTCGPNFKIANNFLWTFKLSSPNGGFSSKTKLLHFLEGGEAGARGEEINAFVKKML